MLKLLYDARIKMAAGAGKNISFLFQDMYSEESISFSLFYMYLPRNRERLLTKLFLQHTNY